MRSGFCAWKDDRPMTLLSRLLGRRFLASSQLRLSTVCITPHRQTQSGLGLALMYLVYRACFHASG